MSLSGKKILLGISGSIAVYKSCELVRRLVQNGASVRVVMTENAKKFVSPLTFSVLSSEDVYTEMFDGLPHIRLTNWADIILVAPATANIIAKVASGIADDLLSTIILAADSPALFVPAMNERMFNSPATQRNIGNLRLSGWNILEPDTGELACGTTGKGRFPPVEYIIASVDRILYNKPDLKGKCVIVTAGPTFENIDPVRVIGNLSSGKTGYAVARECWRRYADVLLISGKTELSPPPGVRIIRFTNSEELFRLLTQKLPETDILVMAAAVSDFLPKKSDAKIKQKEGLTLQLLPNRDILASLKKRTGKIVVGFALETENLKENAEKKLEEKGMDIVYANSPNSISSDETEGVIIERGKEAIPVSRMKKSEFATLLVDRICKLLR
ncbi:bifunctional phosphopantothenoylcysteine decarboxylase/phosphopantothenate--cysteine ligase CoaBC [bacterium]|nr:bifunctional phosphopantothenoylcysteine decarboxylase/phosphopantothenate--cysteine ligase CoaBC [bacterium]